TRRSRASKEGEAWAGIEPAVELLQSSALPLGDQAVGAHEVTRPPRGSKEKTAGTTAARRCAGFAWTRANALSGHPADARRIKERSEAAQRVVAPAHADLVFAALH